MKNPRLLIQEDILDRETLRQLGRVSDTGEKLPLQEIEYRPDEKVRKMKELPEEELAKAIHTLLNREEG